MELLKAIVLGLVQGLTEFLPVSSSGHLVIFSEILNFHETGIAFEVFVHFGTLLATLAAFRYELTRMLAAPYAVWVKKSTDAELKEYLRWDIYVIVASIPAAFIGLLFKDQIEAVFDSLLFVFIMLIFTGTIMVVTPYLKDRGTALNGWRSFVIGIAQAFAILPGVSRSGSTIFTGLLMGIDRDKVARFSFIMSLPAVFGAALLKLRDIMGTELSDAQVLNYIIGTLVAFISGYYAIKWLLDIVKKGKLQWFGYYCYALAALGLSYLFIWR
ncbi:MAG TPA: undecaprenyl-diphosphatase UppP [Caldithrix abyssi]|uniref:Undecaprenyl-diphosphatase n=1 Tax=Caldithrix abyssi TaxID=187145 RepID=A0A7V5VER4_CALAY|nr:undecaprenyl-diphosphatase UppP [Caldithrix abyssi]